MRVVALEEHFTFPALAKRIDPGAISRRGFRPRKAHRGSPLIQRLAQTVDRIRRNLCQPPEELEGLLADLRRTIKPADARYMRWIKASVGRELRLLSIDDVIYFQSDTKYTRVVLAQAEALIRTPLKELLAELDPDVFREGAENSTRGGCAPEQLRSSDLFGLALQ